MYLILSLSEDKKYKQLVDMLNCFTYISSNSAFHFLIQPIKQERSLDETKVPTAAEPSSSSDSKTKNKYAALNSTFL